MTTPLHCLTVPAKETPTALVVWLHGLGASGDDFVPVVPMMNMPWVHWVFPNAPRQAVTINGGMVMPSWYDIRALSTTNSREDVDQLNISADAVEDVIASALSAHSIPEDRVIIAGFSQGGAVTLELLTHRNRTFAGALVLSSYWADEREPPSDVNKDTPVFFGHGTLDPMVPPQRGRRAHDALHAAGRPVSWSEYPMGHEVCMSELQAVATAMASWVPRGTP